MSNPVISWAKSNPVAAGAAAVGIIVVVMLVTGGGSEESDGASGGMGSAGVAAYYDAVSRQGQAGAAIQIAQIQANADTNKALIAANYGIESGKIWAPVSLAGVQANAANEAAQIASNERISANLVNLENSRIAAETALGNSALAVQQNIAFKQANVQNAANKRSFIGGIIGTVVKGGVAIATGGTSLLAGGPAAVKLPALGSPGQWV